MKRRDILKYGGLSSLASFAPAGLWLGNSAKAGKRVLRIAHITDVHVHDEDGAPKGMADCLHEIQNLNDAPDILFNGGDSIDDALGRTRSKVKEQWKIWHSILKNENSLDVINCIGNHDIWGFGDKNDPLYGKKWAMEEMGLDTRYRSFDMAGWHFIVLDSTYSQNGEWYTAKLDEEQFQWLKNDLANVPQNTPVFVLSHIPILCAGAFFDGNNEKSGDWVIPGAWVHIDARRIVELFYQYPNVKACISGHIHLLDQVVYNGVSYYCNGAVSGNWWRGDYHQTPPGYAMINLYDNGKVEREYIPY